MATDIQRLHQLRHFAKSLHEEMEKIFTQGTGAPEDFFPGRSVDLGDGKLIGLLHMEDLMNTYVALRDAELLVEPGRANVAYEDE